MADAPSTAERTHMVPEIPAAHNTDFNRQSILAAKGASRSNLQGTKLFYGTVQLIKQTARAGLRVIRAKTKEWGDGTLWKVFLWRRVHIAECKPHSNFNLNERDHKFPDGNIMRGDFNG